MKDKFTEQISMWLDDELSPSQVRELQTHLTGCPTCHQTYEAMRRVDNMFRVASQVMVVPDSGFSQRFETRLAQRQPARPWQIWLALGALISGTLIFFSVGLFMGGIALASLQNVLLDATLFYQGVAGFIESANILFVFLNMGNLFVKTSFVAMQQPLFWGSLAITASLTWLWVRIMRGGLALPFILTRHMVF